MDENQQAWFLWSLVDTQWRVAAFSIVGLDYPAVFQIAKLYDIEVTPALHQKIRLLEIQELKSQKKPGAGEKK